MFKCELGKPEGSNLTRTGKKRVAQFSTVQILQTVNLLPWSSTGDYMVDPYSKTTLILRRPLCLLNVDTGI